MLVIFDVVGTLFSLDKVEKRFLEKGIRQEIMELWFAKLLQSAMASTLAAEYVPFKMLANSTLRHIFALKNIDEKHFDEVLASLQDIEPRDDALQCLRALRADGHRLVALTNGGCDDTERLLEQWALRSDFERLFSADEAKACKPHPAPYEMVFRSMFAGPYDCCMVSAHGWDILGAESAGMNTIYVERLEKRWPFPGSPAGFIVSTLRDVPDTIAGQYGRPGAWKKAG